MYTRGVAWAVVAGSLLQQPSKTIDGGVRRRESQSAPRKSRLFSACTIHIMLACVQAVRDEALPAFLMQTSGPRRSGCQSSTPAEASACRAPVGPGTSQLELEAEAEDHRVPAVPAGAVEELEVRGAKARRASAGSTPAASAPSAPRRSSTTFSESRTAAPWWSGPIRSRRRSRGVGPSRHASQENINYRLWYLLAWPAGRLQREQETVWVRRAIVSGREIRRQPYQCRGEKKLQPRDREYSRYAAT
jgi:hypothetical protein